jgi:hypothetical protein
MIQIARNAKHGYSHFFCEPPNRTKYERQQCLPAKDAEVWARRAGREIDTGRTPVGKAASAIITVADIMASVGKRLGRSRQYSLDLIKDCLGNTMACSHQLASKTSKPF